MGGGNHQAEMPRHLQLAAGSHIHPHTGGLRSKPHMRRGDSLAETPRHSQRLVIGPSLGNDQPNPAHLRPAVNTAPDTEGITKRD